jgi:ribosomal-protein-alanine N-acetyltransferase
MKIKIQPPLATARLQLHPATLKDLDYLHQLWSLSEVSQYLFDGNKITLGLVRDALDSCLAGASAGFGLWLIHHQQQIIGCAGLIPVRLAPHEEDRLAGLLEPIVTLHPDFWRQGFALEAMDALVDYAFTELQAAALAAVCDEPNFSSLKLLQRAGFELLSKVEGTNYPIQALLLSLRKWENTRHQTTSSHADD